MPGSAQQLATEITVLITGLAAMAFVFLLLRLFNRGQATRQVLNFVRLPILLFAGPVAFLLISYWAWKLPSMEQWEPRGNFYQNSLPFLVFVAEFLCLSATLFRSSRWSARWAITAFAIFHWLFWAFYPWKESQTWVSPMYVRDLLLILLPVSTLLWLWREKPLAQKLAEIMYRHRTLLYGLNAGVAVLAVALWHPARNVELSHPRDWKTVEVEVSRGPCFGSCAVYTMTARGDGRVDYVGRERYSRQETRKSGQISQERISEVLKDLDRVEFTTLDGRAFNWAFDTPSIGVRTSVDGKTKVVVSDEYNERSSVGRQTRFLYAAGEIDTMLRSTVWTQCEGECGGSKPNR
jgi:hypothetical protein